MAGSLGLSPNHVRRRHHGPSAAGRIARNRAGFVARAMSNGLSPVDVLGGHVCG